MSATPPPSEGPDPRRLRRGKVFAVVVPLMVVVGLTLSAEALSRQLLDSGRYRGSDGASWFDTWEYVTVGDPEIGMVLRPGIDSRWTDVEIHVNRSGVRDTDPKAVLEPKRDGEWLIFSLGDSNTFGNHIPFEHTYSARLEGLLQRRTSRRVRVVNLGVSGFTGLQARLLLDRYMHLRPDTVVFADCFNNRAEGTPDTRESLPRLVDYKVWEFGHRISYTVLLVSKQLLDGNQWIGLEQLPLDAELPTARLPLAAYAPLLRELVEFTREAGATPVFLATGDEPVAAAVMRAGLDRFAAGDWAAAETHFTRIVQAHPKWFLGWFHLYRARGRLGRDEKRFLAAYADSAAGTIYLDRFLHLPDDYIAQMRTVAAESGTPLLDMRESFRRERVPFRDVCHYGERAHELIAEALADLVPVEP